MFATGHYLSQHLKRSKSCMTGVANDKAAAVTKTAKGEGSVRQTVVCLHEGCGKEVSKSNFSKHLQVHKEKRPCPRCGRTFSNLSAHSKRCGGSVTCGICGTKLASAKTAHTCKNLSVAYEIHLLEGQDTFELPKSFEDNSSVFDSQVSSLASELSSSEYNGSGGGSSRQAEDDDMQLLPDSDLIFPKCDVDWQEDITDPLSLQEEPAEKLEPDVAPPPNGPVTEEEVAVTKDEQVDNLVDADEEEDPMAELLRSCAEYNRISTEYNAKLMRALNKFN